MNADRVEVFMASMANKFPAEKMMLIRDRLMEMDDTRFYAAQAMSYQDPTILLVVSILVGTLGIDRFLIGDIGLGVLKLLTGGCCGIFTIVDWFLIMNRTKETNFEKFMMC